MLHLAKRFGYYPLVLGQVANYIRSPGVTISSYLETTSGLDKRTLAPSERYEATLQSVFDHVREALPPLTLEWLQVCAYLNADSIPKDYLQTWLETQKECSDSFAAQKILAALVNRRLLRFDPTNQTFSIHRLFQEILKSDEGFTEAAKLLLDKGIALSLKYVFLSEIRQKETDEWTLHVQEILNLPDFKALEEESQAWIMHILGMLQYNGYNGKDEVAFDKYYEVLEIRKKNSKKYYPKIAGSLNGIAIFFDRRSKYDEALELHNQAHAIIE